MAADPLSVSAIFTDLQAKITALGGTPAPVDVYSTVAFNNLLNQYMGLVNGRVAQGAAIPNAAGGGTVDTEARAAINAWLAQARTKGLIAT